ncbi:MAG: hypothetical protein IAE90_10290 [Ignavibacteria bacterium]|nr:hypothetical protein [Ignavibacteria bacterium]
MIFYTLNGKYSLVFLLILLASCKAQEPEPNEKVANDKGNVDSVLNTDTRNSERNIDTLVKIIATGKHYKDIGIIELLFSNNLSMKIPLNGEKVKDLRKNISSFFLRKTRSNNNYKYYLTDTLRSIEYEVPRDPVLTKEERIELLRVLSESESISEECRGNLLKIDSSVSVEFFDFDADGNNELIVLGWNPCFFVNHGSFFFICKKLSGIWKIIFEDWPVEIYDILTTKKNSYYSFYVGGISGRAGNPEVFKVYYHFNGSKYVEYNMTIENMENE